MIEDLLHGLQVFAVVDNQYGDTGKGRLAQAIAMYSDINARGTGGDNAGHTVFVDGVQEVNHILPVGIFYDGLGKKTVLGNGMVINPKGLIKELNRLNTIDKSYNNLMISEDANVIMPYHVARDKAVNHSLKKGGIGSTGKGIGPCYGDKTLRRGVLIRDLFDRDVLSAKIKKAAQFYPEQEINVDNVMEYLAPYAMIIENFACDTTTFMQKSLRQGKKIGIEGAQGFGLSIDFGTYPYVTSSDPSIIGTAAGVGLNPSVVDLTFGLVKFPFMTRVGGGPFPSELGGIDGDMYCRDTTKTVDKELSKHRIPFEIVGGRVKYDHAHPKIMGMMNSKDPLVRSSGIRLVGEEFGATTRRPRRTGWTDGVIGKYANLINGSMMAATKLDCLSGIDEFALCLGYNIDGKEVHDFPRDSAVLRRAEPILKRYKGFGDITGVRKRKDLPGSLQEAMSDYERYTHGKFLIASNGPGRDDNIMC